MIYMALIFDYKVYVFKFVDDFMEDILKSIYNKENII